VKPGYKKPLSYLAGRCCC